MLEAYLELLEVDYFELGEAFKGLADENVWKRPADGSLSVGEIAAHICYAEAIHVAGENLEENSAAEANTRRVISPLIDSRFSYSPKTLITSPSKEHLAMTADDVFRELMRVHHESVAILRESDPDMGSGAPGWQGMTYKQMLKYMVFHVAYHTGQIYSTRHLLSEATPDN